MRVYLCLFGINEETVELALDITDWGCIPREGETVLPYDAGGIVDETSVSVVIYNAVKRRVIVELHDVISYGSEKDYLSAGWFDASIIM